MCISVVVIPAQALLAGVFTVLDAHSPYLVFNVSPQAFILLKPELHLIVLPFGKLKLCPRVSPGVPSSLYLLKSARTRGTAFRRSAAASTVVL